MGLIKVERPEFVCWDFDECARILATAREDGPEWYAAVCLASEAGLRAGEIRALRWHEDVDMIAGTIAVNQQIRQGTARAAAKIAWHPERARPIPIEESA